jgi:PAS domain S-box-containing protein
MCARAFASLEKQDFATSSLQSGDLETWAQRMEPGVYCGWACVDRTGPHPAVAHLWSHDLHLEIYLLRWSSLAEVYPMELRFVASHYMRPEWVLPPNLLADVLQTDMQRALEVLDVEPADDPFLSKSAVLLPKVDCQLHRFNSSPGPLGSDSLNFLETVLRRVSHAAISISVADAESPSCPLIAVSKGFIELTGYSRKNAIGRNCNMLLDGVPPEEQLAHERERINAFCKETYSKEEGTNSMLCVQRNMRRDGTFFWNMFLLQKLHIGNRLLIVGLQKEVSAPPTDERTSLKVVSLFNMDILEME